MIKNQMNIRKPLDHRLKGILEKKIVAKSKMPRHIRQNIKHHYRQKLTRKIFSLQDNFLMVENIWDPLIINIIVQNKDPL